MKNDLPWHCTHLLRLIWLVEYRSRDSYRAPSLVHFVNTPSGLNHSIFPKRRWLQATRAHLRWQLMASGYYLAFYPSHDRISVKSGLCNHPNSWTESLKNVRNNESATAVDDLFNIDTYCVKLMDRRFVISVKESPTSSHLKSNVVAGLQKSPCKEYVLL